MISRNARSLEARQRDKLTKGPCHYYTDDTYMVLTTLCGEGPPPFYHTRAAGLVTCLKCKAILLKGEKKMDEAAELPILEQIRKAESLDEAIQLSIGNASGHWENLEGTGLYQEDQARAVSSALAEWVREYVRSNAKEFVEMPEPKANLGLATTGELLEEVRMRVSLDYLAGGGGLGYTTMNGRPDSEPLEGEVGYIEPVERDTITNYHYGAQITLNVTNYNQPLD